MFQSVRVSARGNAQVLVVGQFKGEKLDRTSARLDAAGKTIAARPEATGDLGAIAEGEGDAFERVLIVGLGDRDGFNAEAGPGRLRTAAASAGRRLAAIKATSAQFEFAGPMNAGKGKAGKVDPALGGKAVGEALGLLSWTYDDLRGSATPTKPRVKLGVRGGDAAFTKGLRRGLGLAEGSNHARRLSQTPPNIATPDWMASQAKAMARKAGLKCTVIKGQRLVDEKMVGLINVGKASENRPCLIRLEYKPARARRGAKPIVLLGKTITYDSGGLSIKVNNGMKGMKRDKDGGGGVFGAMYNIATVIKPSVPVVGLMVAAENSISDEAYRPDDVLTFRNGVTVEVTNTDAEGRLVLADGLCWACDKEKPRAIIDMATLTGGVVIALGSGFAGLWCDDDDLRRALEHAGEATGERVWRLPHDAVYNEMMKSPIADIVNSAPVREAHPIQGAAFLSYFVDKNIPWAHIDIAGVNETTSDKGPFIAGPTGFGARLVAEAVERLATE
ncbi:MAG TPA: leucyl aminopeptidase family protein [Phycisphaerales bacterium]|nr:leucyl aminopeptidase family protein [Phycisphaerales bacterium]